jgi:hypothetical protein
LYASSQWDTAGIAAMPVPSEKSLQSVNRVLTVVVAVALGAVAGLFFFQNRDADLSAVNLNPVHWYFWLMTGYEVEEVAEKAMQQAIEHRESMFESVEGYDPEKFQQWDPDWMRSFNGGPIYDPAAMGWRPE